MLIKELHLSKDDVYTHLYTLVVQPDGKYEVLIDNEKAESGSLEDDWDFLPPKEIKVSERSRIYRVNHEFWDYFLTFFLDTYTGLPTHQVVLPIR